ncbi:MAG: FAD-dependent oxidoreductase [Pseudomonadota bacterium]
MHALVLGAGVVGVTTAYYLSQQGWRTTVVDRAEDVGHAASYANGGQLSYSFTDALARPNFVPTIPGLLLGRSQGTRIKLAPGILPWGARFLAQCTTERARQNTLAVLHTAARSADLMQTLRNEVPIEFSHRKAGKLVLLSNQQQLAVARSNSQLKSDNGCQTVVLTRDEAIEIEPTLQWLTDDFVAAVYSRDDEVADALSFTKGLRQWLEENDRAEFRLAATVKELISSNGAVQAVRVDDEELEADAVVVCMGAWSDQLLGSVGIKTHVYPVRGYSVTLPPGEHAPLASVTALKQQIVFSRINGFVRIAGFADFTGFDTSADRERGRALLELGRRIAPTLADYSVDDVQHWGGYRPMTPDGRPRVGATRLKKLFVNTGHGMLGWTLACASAADAATAVSQSA